ncbi:DUF3592 domain-containing protein [Paraburkholderia adhaesiva]|uniref:DUF3592 domain-containing protein n=1 Tax=Paraburkholderia adhaesiva TaxID=2883244 RepID=UPI001F412CF8|nr:DUF3592 domain-containing protein [Paraburkholderia adhaesiva]
MVISGIGRLVLRVTAAIIFVLQIALIAHLNWASTTVALIVAVPVVFVLMQLMQRKPGDGEQALASGIGSNAPVDGAATAQTQKASPATMKKIAVYLFVIACFATIPPYQTLRMALNLHDEQAWPSVKGQIQAVRVGSTTSKGRTDWYPVWSYSYVVEGKPYSAGNRDLTGRFEVAGFNSEDSAIAAAANRPTGADVTVFYDPTAPQHSVLDRRKMSDLDWEVLLMTLLFPLIPIAAAAVVYGRVCAIDKARSGLSDN